MPRVISFTDLSDPALNVYLRLTEAQLRSPQNPNPLFIAEGVTVIGHALESGCEPVSFLMEQKHIEGKARSLLVGRDVPVYTAPSDLLARLTGFPLTRGVLCAMKRPPLPDPESVLRSARRVAVLEGIVDPANLGSLFRCGAALGMDAMLLTPTCCDPFNRRCVRVSMGTLFQVPWTRIGTSADEWPHPGIERLRSMGFRIAAMALRKDSLSVDDPRLKKEDRLAVVLGCEGDGLAPATIDGSDYSVLIPMSNGVDSLNVSAAGAIAFWQLGKRQAADHQIN